MKTKRLNLVDAAWLNVETPNAPMQVGGLLTFQIPDDAPDNFCQQIYDQWRQHAAVERPWNQRLRQGRFRAVAPEWELLDEIDVDYHFRHSALPAPGGELELGTLTSRLHSHPIDFERPPWECHLIEGLEGRRFAMYLKIHHSLLDGVAGMKLLAHALTTDPDETGRKPFWAIEPSKRKSRGPEQQKPGLYRAVAQMIGDTKDQVTSLGGFASVVRDMLSAARSGHHAMGLPFAAPSSVLNGRIDSTRRYATQLYSLEELKQLAKDAEVTVNDIVLAICGASLRRYLMGIDALPAKPLTAGIPVSVRPADDGEEEHGNAITFIISTLGTHEADPRKRLEMIASSTRNAKASLEKLSASAITQYTVALMAPYVLSLVSGMAGRTRPVFNVTVSNLPGPRESLYINGAEMEAFYPTSLVTHGQALNITVHGYADTLGFGFIGCRDSLPSMQNLAVYAGEALSELKSIYQPDRDPTPAKPQRASDSAGKTNKTKPEKQATTVDKSTSQSAGSTTKKRRASKPTQDTGSASSTKDNASTAKKRARKQPTSRKTDS